MRTGLCRFAAAAATLVLLSGCVETTSGQAVRGAEWSAPAPSYRESLDSNIQAQLKRNDEVRKIDPCSVINLDAAATLGPIKYMGTDRDARSCSIQYDVPELPGQEKEILKKLVPGFVSHIKFGDRLIDRFGRDDAVVSTGGSCSVFRTSGYIDPVSGTPETVKYYVSMSGTDLGVDDPRDGCDDMQRVADASGSQRQHPTLRAESRYVPHSRLMTVDPCAALDSIAQGRVFKLTKPQESLECWYEIEPGTAEVSIRHVFEEYETMPRSNPYRTVLKVRGVTTELSTSGKGPGLECTYSAYVDFEDPHAGSDPKSQTPQWVGTLLVQGTDAKPDCSSLLAVTEEAVRRYQEAK
ncbi:hypothetical protein DE4585_02669 [Mycobacteroides salmoniphilum]|uniref:DUF3558 domain-containing protein n=1 Tax=Mycobacteroides salmoniphilum TaxID=404941 RepID=A0A4R8S3D8_9MYCO|nr:hypothetical protein [Mycobacteroides salmoniphilum]TDZ82137.1 hypothetical protein DE4585_02669 [Mycobacteroides salmoniphilum]